MSNKQKVFRNICAFVAPRINSVIKSNDLEFETAMAATKRIVESRFKNEVDESTLYKILDDLEFQVKTARENFFMKPKSPLKFAQLHVDHNKPHIKKHNKAKDEDLRSEEKDFEELIKEIMTEGNEPEAAPEPYFKQLKNKGLDRGQRNRASYMKQSGF